MSQMETDACLSYTLAGNSYTIANHPAPPHHPSMTIYISGTHVKPFSKPIFLLTVVLGSIFLLPLFCLCSDWWKRKTYGLVTVPPKVFEAVGKLIRACNPMNLTLVFEDHFLTVEKINVLERALGDCRIVNMQIENRCYGYNSFGDNYSQFKSNIAPLLRHAGRAECKWHDQIVTSQKRASLD